MLREDRLTFLVERLNLDGRVVAADLAASLGVPVDMIRRDLRELAARGHCQRVYGGALRPAAQPGARNVAGSPLAKAAARTIHPGQVTYVDVGRTNLAVVEMLDPSLTGTVVTACPAVAIALLQHPAIEVIMIGGKLDRATGSALGALALDAVRDLRFDLCLLGACAIAEEGVSAFQAEDAVMKRHLVSASAATVVAATADKVGTRASFHVMPVGSLDRLIVETGAPEAELARMREAGVEVEQVAAHG